MEIPKSLVAWWFRMFSLCPALEKMNDAKMKMARGNDIGVFKGDFGRCPRCSWMLHNVFL